MKQEPDTEATVNFVHISPKTMSEDQIIDTFGKMASSLIDIKKENIHKIIQFLRDIAFTIEIDQKLAKTLVILISKVSFPNLIIL